MASCGERNGHKRPGRCPSSAWVTKNWGCGGSMRAEYYADLYRRYSTYLRNFGDKII